MIDALLTTSDVEPAGWALIGLIILSGLATMMIMTRAGIDLLWTPGEDAPSRLSLVEVFRSEEHTSELQSLMRISYAVFCLKKKTTDHKVHHTNTHTQHLNKNAQIIVK